MDHALVEGFCDLCRRDVLAEIQRIVRAYGASEESNNLILDYPLRPAKALRPAVCIALTRALGGTEQGVLCTAAVIELLHNAFLIHDDVEDESEYRRGELTLQRARGLPTAVNVADGMFALALSALLENTELLDLRSALGILELVATTLRDTFAGQALELSWIQQNRVRFVDEGYRAAYERLVLLKTTTYSFLLPVRVACLCARVPVTATRALCRYAEHLGAAFQITDDLLNLRDDVVRYGKEIDGDLWEGKRTLMLLHALHAADDAEQARAKQSLARLRSVVSRSTVLDAMASRIAGLYEEAHIDAFARDALSGILGAATRDQRTDADVRALKTMISRYNGVGYAQGVAGEHAEAAAAALGQTAGLLAPGRAREFLEQLPRYVIDRLS